MVIRTVASRQQWRGGRFPNSRERTFFSVALAVATADNMYYDIVFFFSFGF